ncbi:hypothetical protein HWV23_13245 [Natronomonas halophila]|uniref:hypothetical protein n=1 Tax=Natronomonas halophila TaxID=2747817 RepID=UPI0015B78B80|nr:hypothetical protein [Natronomonas halophila]QLD86650.1 hypothetical protein HWV23_13245 [Natronomonas halophila]
MTADGDAIDVDTDRVKASLRRLTDTDDATVIARADAAIDDLDKAAAFVESVGLDRLEAAVEATEAPTRRETGERALEAFRRFRAAASGDGVHFHRGRGTDLRGGTEESTR